jgi:hypothetical protein
MHLIGIDAASGKAMWDVAVAESADAACNGRICYSITHAPLVAFWRRRPTQSNRRARRRHLSCDELGTVWVANSQLQRFLAILAH